MSVCISLWCHVQPVHVRTVVFLRLSYQFENQSLNCWNQSLNNLWKYIVNKYFVNLFLLPHDLISWNIRRSSLFDVHSCAFKVHERTALYSYFLSLVIPWNIRGSSPFDAHSCAFDFEVHELRTAMHSYFLSLVSAVRHLKQAEINVSRKKNVEIVRNSMGKEWMFSYGKEYCKL